MTFIEQSLSLETVALHACRDDYYDLPFNHNTFVTDHDGRQPCQWRLQHCCVNNICQRQTDGRPRSV